MPKGAEKLCLSVTTNSRYGKARYQNKDIIVQSNSLEYTVPTKIFEEQNQKQSLTSHRMQILPITTNKPNYRNVFDCNQNILNSAESSKTQTKNSSLILMHLFLQSHALEDTDGFYPPILSKAVLTIIICLLAFIIILVAWIFLLYKVKYVYEET